MTGATSPMLAVDGVDKSFTLHLRDGVRLPVVRDVRFEVGAGECVALGGASGAGKSSILKIVYGNYRADTGRVLVRDGEETVDIATAPPRRILALRRTAVGYVSQFLRVIPRVGALDVVAEPVIARDSSADARGRAAGLLARLNLPEKLWMLPPATFSGGEQQRVNIARGFAPGYPLLLLDEPTASLDAVNRAAVIGLIDEAKAAGTAILGIFHDDEVREAVADRVVDVTRFGAHV